MKGLIIRSPWMEEILRGRKTWEIRGSRTKVRGRIALIRSGSSTVVGTCELVDVIGPLSLADLERSVARHRVPVARLRAGLPYIKTYAWVLREAKPLARPLSYNHPHGAVIFVNLPDSILRRSRLAASARH